MGESRVRILVVDDDKLVREMLRDFLEPKYQVVAMPDGPSAIEALRQESFSVVISDQVMPGKSGVEVLQECMELQPRAVRMLMTASERVVDLRDAVNLARVHRCIVKPFRQVEVDGAIASGLREVALEQENLRLVQELRERERELERELQIRTQELKDVMDQLLKR